MTSDRHARVNALLTDSSANLVPFYAPSPIGFFAVPGDPWSGILQGSGLPRYAYQCANQLTHC